MKADIVLQDQWLQGCPPALNEVMEHIEALRFYCTPNYGLIYDILRSILGHTPERPYDWEKMNALDPYYR